MAPQHTRCSSLVAGKRPVLLVYVRIALPAIRSAKPGRRKTAAAIIASSGTPGPAVSVDKSQSERSAWQIRGQVTRTKLAIWSLSLARDVVAYGGRPDS